MNASALSAVAVLMLVFLPIDAAAQPAGTRPERPYRGVFGSGVTDPAHLFTIGATLGSGYDDNVLADVGGDRGLGSSGPGRARGGFGRIGGDIAYSLNLRRVSFSTGAATVTRYFPRLGHKILASYTGNVGGSIQLAEGTRLSASQSIDRMPYFSFAPFPALFDVPIGQVTAPIQDVGASRQDVVSYASDVDFTQKVGRRSTLAFSYGSHVSVFDASDSALAPVDDLRTRTAAGRFTHGLTKGLGLRLGYGYTVGKYGGGDPTNTLGGHSIDAGVDFNRALSFSRRTTLSFGTGTSAMRDRDQTSYRLTGFARLDREIGRTWRASVGYDRNFSFVEGLEAPLFYNTATLSITGLVNRRVEFSVRTGASIGEVGTSGGYDTYFASVGFAAAFNRHVGVGGDYSYYRYAFDAGVTRWPGLPSQMDRQSVQVYLKLWAPLVYRARRVDAAR